MKSRRTLSRTLATESLSNARRLLASARRLRRAGARGHAAALGVLSVEESSKALIYHFAAEGVYRVVAKKPNHISTFTEKELLDHRFKHSFLASLFLDYLLYAPFYEALEAIGRWRKTAIPKGDVRLLILQAIQGHRRLQVEMSGGGRAAKEVQRLFSLLQSLGAIKNRGLYVDHREGRVQSPRETPKEQLDDVLALAEGAIAMVEEASKRPYSVREKELQREENKRLLTAIRQARRRTLKGPATPVATTDGAPEARRATNGPIRDGRRPRGR